MWRPSSTRPTARKTSNDAWQMPGSFLLDTHCTCAVQSWCPRTSAHRRHTSAAARMRCCGDWPPTDTCWWDSLCTSAAPSSCLATCAGQHCTSVVACRTSLGEILHPGMCWLGTRCTRAAVGDCPAKSPVLQCSTAVPCIVQRRDSTQYCTKRMLYHHALGMQHQLPCVHSCKMCTASAHTHGHLSLSRPWTRTAHLCKLCAQRTCRSHCGPEWELPSCTPCLSRH